jgi:hypothetical protein
MLVSRRRETSRGVPTSSAAFSDEAQTLQDKMLSALRDLRSTSRSVALEELFSAFMAHRATDELDEGCSRVSVDAFTTARDFLYALPTAFPSPEVAATREGEIALDWFPARASTFSVLATADRKLIFATATPERRLRGVESFHGEVPSALLDELRRLF